MTTRFPYADRNTGTTALTAWAAGVDSEALLRRQGGGAGELVGSSPSQAKELVPPEVRRPNGHEAERTCGRACAAATGHYVGRTHNAGAWNPVDGVDGWLGLQELTIRYATNDELREEPFRWGRVCA
ncbi:MAG: hypothetical protein IPP09_10765 [Elusimicrobia bacterium]|nr:hypothetical protein [Elusimicrobiota bacterium]